MYRVNSADFIFNEKRITVTVVRRSRWAKGREYRIIGNTIHVPGMLSQRVLKDALTKIRERHDMNWFRATWHWLTDAL